MPEQKLVQGSFLSWKGLRFLGPLILRNFLNELFENILYGNMLHYSFPPGQSVKVGLAVGQGLGRLAAPWARWELLSIQGGHEL